MPKRHAINSSLFFKCLRAAKVTLFPLCQGSARAVKAKEGAEAQIKAGPAHTVKGFLGHGIKSFSSLLPKYI